MRSTTTERTAALFLGLVLMMLTTQSGATAPPPPLPNPVLYLMGAAPFQTGGKQYIRYTFDVLNKMVCAGERCGAAKLRLHRND